MNESPPTKNEHALLIMLLSVDDWMRRISEHAGQVLDRQATLSRNQLIQYATSFKDGIDKARSELQSVMPKPSDHAKQEQDNNQADDAYPAKRPITPLPAVGIDGQSAKEG
jgi:hypothetical protein